MEFEDALAALGFSLDRESRGVRHYARRPNPYLTYWVQARPRGEAIFSWEFAISEYAGSLGMQVGSGEELNTFLYPRQDLRGSQDPRWLAECLESTEALLGSFALLEAPADPAP